MIEIRLLHKVSSCNNLLALKFKSYKSMLKLNTKEILDSKELYNDSKSINKYIKYNYKNLKKKLIYLIWDSIHLIETFNNIDDAIREYKNIKDFVGLYSCLGVLDLSKLSNTYLVDHFSIIIRLQNFDPYPLSQSIYNYYKLLELDRESYFASNDTSIYFKYHFNNGSESYFSIEYK